MNSCSCCGEALASSLPAEAPRRRSMASTSASPRPATSSAGSLNGDQTCCKVLTVGHSTRQIKVFLELLAGHGVTQLVDVRTVPRSRHNPQFNQATLPISLAAVNIGYVHASGLGGFRPTAADSSNTGWRNLSFRGYADYMQTMDFAVNLASVIELARTDRVALMCAEAVPWRCHRSLIADALLVHGVAACEIVSPKRLQPHKLTPFACVQGEQITYPFAQR